MSTTRKLFVSAIAITAVLLSTASVRAEQPDKFKKPHEPFTAYGMQVRMSVVNPIDKSWQNGIQPIVFQEIAPCRLSSTLIPDHYDAPWGGPAYRPNESRHYPSRGVLETATFVNHCSETVPYEAIGIVGRFVVTPGDGDGEVHIDTSDPTGPDATTVFKFKKGEVLMFEAGVMFASDGTFGVATWNAGADVTVDILGYLLPDPAPTAGPKGDKGDRGDAGETGATGATGANGEKGDKGDTGATGATGANGAKGDVGLTGDKGDQGDTGATGAKGDKGDIGANGAKGDKGDTGPKGATGEKGNKGDKGDVGLTGAKGDKGETGAAGAKGDKGDIGANGAKGDKGDTGPKGAAGEKGSKGDTGLQGPAGTMGPEGRMGPAGPQGPPGPAGFTAVKGHGCYPPGNNANSQLTVYDGSVRYSSIVILNYTDAGSNGNALAIISQSAGSFQTTGSPNKCFQYVVLNAAQ
jgi:hypothetical protein